MKVAGTLLAALFCSAAALAQGPAAPWSAAAGAAGDLAIAPTGEVYAAGLKGDLWRWRSEDSSWAPIPGTALRIAAGPAGRLWGVRADGSVVRYEAGRWQALPGPRARDVALDAQGDAFVAREDGSLARWNAAGRDWLAISGRGHRLAVHPDGSIWTLGEDGSITRWRADQGEPLPGRARDIAIGGNTVAIASSEGRLEKWNDAARTWDEVPGAPQGIAQVALAPDGTAWTASASGAIRTQAPVKMQLAIGAAGAAQQPDGVTFNRRGTRGSAGARGTAAARARAGAAAVVVLKPPAAITDPAPFEFVDTLGTASRIAIGADGNVFAIALDGSLARWSNARRAFVTFPGSLVRLAVDAGGTPWGINQAGRIFRHTGTDWRQVRGTASDISIALNGTVMITSSAGTVSRYEPTVEGFLQVPGELYFIALAPDGVPWGLLRDGTVLRCAAIPCERVGIDARNISIGPDGSVFIVNFANELRRFNAATGLFDFIPVPGHVPASVAVGPFGRPWVVTTAGKVLSSRFFNRDEELDLLTAGTTVTPTTGTGDVATVLGTTSSSSGFSFSRNMQVNTVTIFNLGCQIPFDVAVGAEGTVLVLCDGPTLGRYSTSTKGFVVETLPTSNVRTMAVDSEGRIWILASDVDGRIYRQRQKNGSTYDILQVPITNPAQGNPGFANLDIAIGPDDTVYVIDTGGNLYRRTKSQTTFSKMIAGTFQRVAVGASNDVWVRERGGVTLYQIVSGQLEKRPPVSGVIGVTDVGGGADGSIYVCLEDTFVLAKWNASNKTFDSTNRTCDRVAVSASGRPWFINSSSSSDVFYAR